MPFKRKITTPEVPKRSSRSVTQSKGKGGRGRNARKHRGLKSARP